MPFYKHEHCLALLMSKSSVNPGIFDFIDDIAQSNSLELADVGDPGLFDSMAA